jgi:YhcH/YjgK/YiaL family protein
MIIGSLENTLICEKTHRLFKRVFDYLKTTDISHLPLGKTEPEGERFFISLSQNEGKSKDTALIETHDKYIDIQIILEGEETMGWLPRTGCSAPQSEYNADSDIILYDDKPCTYFTVRPGEYAVFFPEDGHAPCIGTGTIRKAVIKVPIE